ncbi:hypothetical protein ACFYO0_22785 [Streptomyces sp. NPDC006365]|uniref:hypothetical protein n=1 Tax=Streptomyces sp. NPDC006365 TaxID=3364744 RepID=UPI0036B0B186
MAAQQLPRRRLVFKDEGYWQNPSGYSFDRKAPSYWNRRDDDAAFQAHTGVKVCIASGQRSASMTGGGWNDAVPRVYPANTDNNC